MKKKLVAVIIFSLVMVILTPYSQCCAIGFDAEGIYSSVFIVYSGDSMGSGFAVGENCLITNAHVISDKDRVRISSYDGNSYHGYVIARDEALDLAVLSISGASFKPLSMISISKVNVGDDVYAIGAPNAMAYTLTKGVISSKDRLIRGQSYIQTDAAINTGNSGGPLLTDSGFVLGVNTLKLSDAEGIGLAIPMDRVVQYLNQVGIETSTEGIVKNPLPADSEEDTVPDQNGVSEESGENETENNNPVPAIVWIVMCVSLALNVCFIIRMVREKKKNDKKAVLSERTDFEIDFLE